MARREKSAPAPTPAERPDCGLADKLELEAGNYLERPCLRPGALVIPRRCVRCDTILIVNGACPTCTALPFGLDPGQLVEPYCACGRVVSRCDRSRAACRLPPRPSRDSWAMEARLHERVGEFLGFVDPDEAKAHDKLELEAGNYLELDDGHSPPGCCLLVHDACEDIKEQPVDAFLPADAAGLRRIARWLSAWADELDARAREGQ